MGRFLEPLKLRELFGKPEYIRMTPPGPPSPGR